jgi:hypothetical protein
MAKTVLKIDDWKKRLKSLKLHDKNVKEWKIEYERLMIQRANFKGASSVFNDEEWVEQCGGMTPLEVVEEEISNWD